MLYNFIFSLDKMISLGNIKLFCEPVQNNEYFKIILKDNKTLTSFNYKFSQDNAHKIISDVSEYIDSYNSSYKRACLNHDVVERKCLVLLKAKNICYQEAKAQILSEIENTGCLATIPVTFPYSVLLLLDALELQRTTRLAILQEKKKWLESDIYANYKKLKSSQHYQINKFLNSTF